MQLTCLRTRLSVLSSNLMLLAPLQAHVMSACLHAFTMQTLAGRQLCEAYKHDLLGQIQAHRETQRAERQQYLEEGKKIRQLQQQEKAVLEQVGVAAGARGVLIGLCCTVGMGACSCMQPCSLHVVANNMDVCITASVPTRHSSMHRPRAPPAAAGPTPTALAMLIDHLLCLQAIAQ